MATARLGQDGTVVLPESVRLEAGLKPGDTVEIEVEANRVVRISPRKVQLKDLYGILAPADRVVTIEEMNDAIAEGRARR